MANLFDQFDAAPAQPSGNAFDQFDSEPRNASAASIAAQGGLGIAEGSLDLASAVDPFANAERGLQNVTNAALGTNYQFPTMPDINRKILGAVGADPSQYPAQNTPERIARFAGSLLPGTAIPGGEGAGLAAKVAEIPTTDALRAAAKAAYHSPAVADLKLAPQVMDDLYGRIHSRLMGDDIHPLLAPKTYGIADQMTAVPDGTPFVTAANVQTLRRVLGKAAQSTDPTERLAARSAQNTIDDFMANLPPQHVLSGDADAAASALNGAKGNYAALMRTERLNEAVDKAGRQAARAGVGGNWENATRQKISSILDNPARSRGMTDDEKSALGDYVAGNFSRNALRAATKVLGGDNPLMASIHAGAALGAAIPTGGLSLAGLVAPVTGYALKRLNDVISGRQLDRLNEMLRSRSPLADQLKSAAQNWAHSQMQNDPGRIAGTSRILAGRLKGAGISADPSMLAAPLQLPGPAAADTDQKDIPRPPRQQKHGGRVAQANKAAHGGKVKNFFPQSIGARRAKDGQWYVRDKSRPGKYLRVVAHA